MSVNSLLTQGTLNLRWRLRNLSSHHDLHFGRVNQNIVLVDKVTQKFHLVQPELTLEELGVKVLPAQGIQHLPQVLLKLLTDRSNMGLHTRFMRSMNAAGGLVSPKGVTTIS